MKRLLWIAVLSVLLCAAAGGDELEDRALAYEGWFNEYHVSPYGGTGYAYFEEPGSFEVVGYSFSDSTIWTGTYLAAECFRYAVTGDPEAKANAIRTVHALDAHLQITQVPGFIARFAGPDEFPWNAHYIGHDRYVAGTGEWEGSFWINNTSRDQYTGWFMGLATAYDLIDDEPTRELIRRDVRAVIDKLRADGYLIIGEDGAPTDAGPEVLPPFQLAWHLIAAHVLDEPYYWELYEERFRRHRDILSVSLFSWFNKYHQYYGFNLTHENFFGLLRLETDPVRRSLYLDVFHRQVRSLVEHTHNVFFDEIYLANCRRAGECRDYEATARDIAMQLRDFQDPPVREVPLEIPEWPLDPISVLLSDLIDELGIRDLIDIEPQTLDPRPVRYRCPRSFMWQKSPYNLDCPGGDGTEVYPGIDYLIAYWMGRYYGFIAPGNPGGVYWPENDEPPPADDDWSDDDAPDGSGDDDPPPFEGGDTGDDGDDDSGCGGLD